MGYCPQRVTIHDVCTFVAEYEHQSIHISYDLVGFIPVEELLKQETA